MNGANSTVDAVELWIEGWLDKHMIDDYKERWKDGEMTLRIGL